MARLTRKTRARHHVSGMVGDDPSIDIPAPTDAELQAAGIDTSSVDPQGRAALVAGYNAARQAMASAHAGDDVKAISSTIGLVVLVGSFTPIGPELAAMGAIWSGSIAAIKWLGDNVFGWAHGGTGKLGNLTQWFHDYPPQGTSAADGDGNWFDPVNGYRPGADTPYTHGGQNYVGPAYGLGPTAPRIDAAWQYGDAAQTWNGPPGAGDGARAFALFAVPIVYRALELAMNGRWPLDSQGFALLGPDAAKEAAAQAIRLWNSQHDGPSIVFVNDPHPLPEAIPFAPTSFTLNVGPMRKKVRSLHDVLGGMTPPPHLGVPLLVFRAVGQALGGHPGAQVAVSRVVASADAGNVAAQGTVAQMKTAHDALAALAYWIQFYGGARKAF